MVKKLIKMVIKYPIRMINSIYTYFYYKDGSGKEKYELDGEFNGGEKVLVLSTHVDDETIGLGATLLKHRDGDNEMSLVYLTDGGGSTSHSSREELVRQRKEEGYKVKDFYGFNSLYFLDELDGQLDSSEEELVEKILHILHKEEPSIIYSPFLIDGHGDHVETTKSLIKALELWNKDFHKVYMYEVNCPIVPELISSLTTMDQNLYAEKGKAYNIFSSQWAMGFNAFRLLDRRKGLLAQNTYGAEVFVKMNTKALMETVKVLEKQGFKPEDFRQISSDYNLLFAFRTNEGLKKRYSENINPILSKGSSKL